MKKILWLLVLPLLVHCSKSGSGTGSMSIVFTSSTLSTRAERVGSGCSVTTDTGGSEIGKCYTPLQVAGIFNQASLSKAGGGAPVRILGGGSESGLASVFKKAAFDLKTSPTIASSEDNIEDGGGTYDILSMNLQAIEYSFIGDSSNEVFHVRIPFTGTPPSSVATFSSCGLGGGLATADELGTLFGSVVAQAGDILVCVKATTTETCADADYQWVDAGGTLYSTRPGSPKQLTGTYLKTADTCTDGADHPELNWGYASIDLLLSSAVTVSASSSGGVKQYTSGGTTGSKVLVNLDIGMADSIFVNDTVFAGGDLSAQSKPNILAAIESVLFKPVYIKNKKTSSTAGTGDLTATATLTVSP